VTARVLALGDAIARLRDPAALEEFSPLGAEPLLAVELAGDAGAHESALAAALARLPAPSVAVLRADAAPGARRCAAHFDVVVATDRELACVAAAARATPLAAAALAQLLRHGAARTTEAGLVAESLAYATLQAGPEFRAWLATRSAPPPRAASGAPLQLRRDGASLHLSFDRPAKRNAFSAALRDALVEALQLAVSDDSIESVAIDGAGPAFCAGGDLDEFGTLPDPATAHAIRTTRSAARLLAQCADRVEVRVHGACVGAGIELAAFAGRVVARDDAWFALPERAMGLVPGAGGTVSLPRRIGRQRTAWLALTGARIDAATALAWRLIDAIA
jgi:enoyl-CoA hydratase/carnithine racemase